ncbi:MAG TPA: hypothetical protein VKR41_02330 [Puia sp.]|nr:hypothetical protein [Puia sp.]
MLKRIAAILLLSVLLFNWVGYRLLTAYWEDRANARFEATLEKDYYDPAQLILVRVSADALPYSNASERFERFDRSIEIGAARYHTVKRRLYNDSIEFLCIPDCATSQLKLVKEDFFRLVNDLQNSGHSKFPGPSGKTPPVNKIVWCNSSHFPNLYYFAALPVPSPTFQRTTLSPGHPRIGLHPPQPGNPLS